MKTKEHNTNRLLIDAHVVPVVLHPLGALPTALQAHTKTVGYFFA